MLALTRCLCSALMAAMLLAFLLALISSPFPADASSQGRIAEFQVSTSRQIDQEPDIDDSTVVWSSINTAGKKDVHGYDLNTRAFFVLSDKPFDEGHPEISGDWVVWIEDVRRVIARNLATGEERVIVSPFGRGVLSVNIGGEYVVWSDTDIWLYHIPTQNITLVTGENPEWHNDEPAVDWPWVVWHEQRGSAQDTYIRAYNIISTRVLTLTDGERYPGVPDVSDGVVVWNISGPSGSRNIFGLDLNTGEHLTITYNMEDNRSPRIDRKLIVWTASGNVCAHNLDTHETISVTMSETADAAPSVSGNVIVWRRFEGDDSRDFNIYGVILLSETVFLPLVSSD